MASTPGLPGSTSYFSGVRQTLTFRGGGAAQPGPLSPLIRPHSMLACHGSKRWTEEGCNSMLVSGDKWPLHRAYTWDGPPGLTPRRSGSRRGGYPQRRDWTRIVGASLLLQSEATPPLEARSDLSRRNAPWRGALTGPTLAGGASVVGVGPPVLKISRNQLDRWAQGATASNSGQ